MITKKAQKEHTEFLLEIATLRLLLEVPGSDDVLLHVKHVAETAQRLALRWLHPDELPTQDTKASELISLAKDMLNLCSKLSDNNRDVEIYGQIKELIDDLTTAVIQMSKATESLLVTELLQSYHQLKDRLEALPEVTNTAELVPMFRKYAEALLLALQLTEQLRSEVLSARLAAGLGVSATSLRSFSPELVNKLQANIERPTDEDAMNDCRSTVSCISQIIEDVVSVIERETSENWFESSERFETGRFVGCIDEALDRVLALSAISTTIDPELSTSSMSQLDILVEFLIRHSLSVAAVSTGREHHRLVSAACLRVLESRKRLASCCLQSACLDDDGVADGQHTTYRQQLELLQCEAEKALRDLERHVNATLLHSIVDTFKESADPLEQLLSTVLRTKQEQESLQTSEQLISQRSLLQQLNEFEDQANKVCSVADFFADSCAEYNVWKRLTTSTNQLKSLQASILANISQPPGTWEVETLKSITRQWHREVRRLVSTIDDSTDVSLFLRTTEQQLHVDVEAHERQWNDAGTDAGRQLLLHTFARAVVGRAERAAAVARVAISRAAHRGGPTYVSKARECTDELLKAAAGFHAEAWRLAETADILSDTDHERAKKSMDEKLHQLLAALASLRCHVILADSPERPSRYRSSNMDSDGIGGKLQSDSTVSVFRRISPARSGTYSDGSQGARSGRSSPNVDGQADPKAAASMRFESYLALSGNNGTAVKPMAVHVHGVKAPATDYSGFSYHANKDNSRFLSLPVWSRGTSLEETAVSSSHNHTSLSHCLPHANASSFIEKLGRSRLPHMEERVSAENLQAWPNIDVDLSTQMNRAMSSTYAARMAFNELLKRANTCLDVASSVGPCDSNSERRKEMATLRTDVASLTPLVIGLYPFVSNWGRDRDEASVLMTAWCRAINTLEDCCDVSLRPYSSYSHRVVKSAMQFNKESLRVETQAAKMVWHAASTVGAFALESCGSIPSFSCGGSDFILRQLKNIERLTEVVITAAYSYDESYSCDVVRGFDANLCPEDDARSRRQELAAHARAWAHALFELNYRITELCHDYLATAYCTLDQLDYSSCVKQTEEASGLLEIALSLLTTDEQAAASAKAARTACKSALAALNNTVNTSPCSDLSSLFAGAENSVRLCAWQRSLEKVHSAIDAAFLNVCKPVNDIYQLFNKSDLYFDPESVESDYRKELQHQLEALTLNLSGSLSTIESALEECDDVSLKMKFKFHVSALKAEDGLKRANFDCNMHSSGRMGGECNSKKQSLRRSIYAILHVKNTIRQLILAVPHHAEMLGDSLMQIESGWKKCAANRSIAKVHAVQPNIQYLSSQLLGSDFHNEDTDIIHLRSSFGKTTGDPKVTTNSSFSREKVDRRLSTVIRASDMTGHGVNAVKALLARSQGHTRLSMERHADAPKSSTQKWEDDTVPVVGAAKQMTMQLREIARLATLQRLDSSEKCRVLSLAREMSTNSGVVLQIARTLLNETPELRHPTRASLLVDCTRAETVAAQLIMSANTGAATIEKIETRSLIAHNAEELMVATFETVRNAEAAFIEACGRAGLDTLTAEPEALRPAVTWMQQLRQHRHSQKYVGPDGNGRKTERVRGELNELGLRRVLRKSPGPELCEIFKQR